MIHINVFIDKGNWEYAKLSELQFIKLQFFFLSIM